MSEKKLCCVIAENPLLILFLGACTAMGATTTLLGAVAMGVAALIVMVLSALVITALKKVIPECARIPAVVIIVTGFVSIVQMLMNAFLPEIYQMLGIYVAVAAVDLLIFGTADESCVVRAVKNGLRFLVILVIMGLVREVLGSGSVAGFDIAFLADYTIPVMTKAPGGFVVYSILAAVISKLHKNPKLEGNSAACAAAGLDVCCCKNEEVEQ
jgi:electron transport complex protein RnfE